MYTLVPLVGESKKPLAKKVPTPMYCDEKNLTEAIDRDYSPPLITGYLTAKKYSGGGGDRKSTLTWGNYFYVLRRFVFYFYTKEVQDGQLFYVEIT